DKTTRYPHRYRRYFNPVFKGQALRIGEHILALPLGKGREPINEEAPRASRRRRDPSSTKRDARPGSPSRLAFTAGVTL
nr:hypothetical protein [Thermaerobacter sp.]